MEIAILFPSFFRAVAAKKACTKYAFIARYTTSDSQMFDEVITLMDLIICRSSII